MTRPGPIRAGKTGDHILSLKFVLTGPFLDTFDLQANLISPDDALQSKQESLGFDSLGDENEDIYDEDGEDYDDGDAVSSSPSIPDDVCPSSILFCVKYWFSYEIV